MQSTLSLSLPFTSKKGHSFTKNQTINFIVNGSEEFKEKREKLAAQLYDATLENDRLRVRVEELDTKVFEIESMVYHLEKLENLVVKLARMVGNFQHLMDVKNVKPEVASTTYLDVAKAKTKTVDSSSK